MARAKPPSGNLPGASDLGHRIAEEIQSAAKFGYTPETPFPLNERFRVEGLTAVAPTSSLANEAPSMMPSATRAGMLRINNPFRDLSSEEEIRSNLNRLLTRLAREGRDDYKQDILEQYMAFAATVSDEKKISAVEKQIFPAVFGADYVKNTEGGRASHNPKKSK
jgi:hypothetical protein